MGRAELWFLNGDGYLVVKRCFKLFAAMTCDDDLPVRFEAGGAFQKVVQHRAAGDRMQDLVQITAHARAFSGGENDNGEGRGGIGHGASSASNRLPIPAGEAINPPMIPFPFDIVGFDLDGTLLDTHVDLAEAVNHALALIGREPVPAARVRDLVGGGARKMLARALDVTGGPIANEEFERLHRELIVFYEANIARHSVLFPGGQRMLDGLADRGVRIAVVTNKLERLAVRLLGELGLLERFFTVIGGDTLGPGRAKPAPDLLHEMIARAGRGRTAYVGDTTYDTRAAAAAGIPCIVVSFGFNDLPPEDLGAAGVIGHFDELIPSLERLRIQADAISQ